MPDHLPLSSQDEERQPPLRRTQSSIRRARSLPNIASDDQRSLFSNDIWLDDHSGLGKGFAREVSINGWTVVGDTKRGAYIGAKMNLCSYLICTSF